ncbi:MAG: type II toxin-antitoxin system HicB family antitoxin [Bifidobacteriaceae bacterium]|jgi:hypothetical protein|nr:type II toxin-antitoxin system HicB family antitoxin [Bifidobacteriaceae bacterium]
MLRKKMRNTDMHEAFDFSHRENVTALEGDEARRFGSQLIKDAAGGVDTLEEAHTILFGRPTLEKQATREKTEQVQVRIPHSWKRRIDKAAKSKGQTRSVFLRNIIKKEIF